MIAQARRFSSPVPGFNQGEAVAPGTELLHGTGGAGRGESFFLFSEPFRLQRIPCRLKPGFFEVAEDNRKLYACHDISRRRNAPSASSGIAMKPRMNIAFAGARKRSGLDFFQERSILVR